MALDAGRLDERVVVQQLTSSRNSIGEAIETWSTFATRWASVSRISSREFLQNSQQQTEATHRVRMRYVSGMTHAMRLLWRGAVLEITSLLEKNNRSEVELLCLERVEAS